MPCFLFTEIQGRGCLTGWVSNRMGAIDGILWCSYSHVRIYTQPKGNDLHSTHKPQTEGMNSLVGSSIDDILTQIQDVFTTTFHTLPSHRELGLLYGEDL